jgi:hypothetical protein
MDQESGLKKSSAGSRKTKDPIHKAGLLSTIIYTAFKSGHCLELHVRLVSWIGQVRRHDGVGREAD